MAWFKPTNTIHQSTLFTQFKIFVCWIIITLILYHRCCLLGKRRMRILRRLLFIAAQHPFSHQWRRADRRYDGSPGNKAAKKKKPESATEEADDSLVVVNLSLEDPEPRKLVVNQVS